MLTGSVRYGSRTLISLRRIEREQGEVIDTLVPDPRYPAISCPLIEIVPHLVVIAIGHDRELACLTHFAKHNPSHLFLHGRQYRLSPLSGRRLRVWFHTPPSDRTAS
jgi:hypothetical protein